MIGAVARAQVLAGIQGGLQRVHGAERLIANEPEKFTAEQIVEVRQARFHGEHLLRVNRALLCLIPPANDAGRHGPEVA